jgi:hypothetical protein
LSARIRSNSRAVNGPILSAQRTIREGVHSIHVCLVRLRAVLRIRHRLAPRADAEMRGNPLTFVKDFNCRGG